MQPYNYRPNIKSSYDHQNYPISKRKFLSLLKAIVLEPTETNNQKNFYYGLISGIKFRY